MGQGQAPSPDQLDVSRSDQPPTVDGASVVDALTGKSWRDYLHGEHCTCYAASEEMQFLTDGQRRYIWFPEQQLAARENGNFNPASNPVNHTLALHGQGRVNYQFADGHVALYHAYDSELVGTGDPITPKGAWTIEAGPKGSRANVPSVGFWK